MTSSSVSRTVVWTHRDSIIQCKCIMCKILFNELSSKSVWFWYYGKCIETQPSVIKLIVWTDVLIILLKIKLFAICLWTWLLNGKIWIMKYICCVDIWLWNFRIRTPRVLDMVEEVWKAMLLYILCYYDKLQIAAIKPVGNKCRIHLLVPFWWFLHSSRVEVWSWLIAGLSVECVLSLSLLV